MDDLEYVTQKFRDAMDVRIDFLLSIDNDVDPITFAQVLVRRNELSLMRNVYNDILNTVGENNE